MIATHDGRAALLKEAAAAVHISSTVYDVPNTKNVGDADCLEVVENALEKGVLSVNVTDEPHQA